jgi:PAS domain S-box-containing protein
MSLLQQVASGKYEELPPERFEDSNQRELVKVVNRIHQQRQQIVNRYTRSLERSENRLWEIIENTPIGLCITDEYGYFEYVNPNYCKLYGYEAEELLGHHFTTVVPEDNRKWLTRLHDEFMGRRYELRGEWPVVRKDGMPLTVLADAAYIIDIDEQPKKVTFVIDITDRKNAETQLKETVDRLQEEMDQRRRIEKTKRQVERIIQHDLRNPLNSILTASQLLERTELSEEQQELVEMIKDSGYKLNHMISSSLDFVRMEEGEYEPNFRPVNVIDVLSDVDGEIASLKHAYGVPVRYRVDHGEVDWNGRVEMSAEEFYLENMLTNLVRNAIEASPRGEEVTLHVHTGETMRFEIHNHGVVPEEIRDVFFSRYATAGKRGGTGLGTYVAALITRTHKGRIRFTTDEGEGTRLIVELPRQPEQSQQLAEAKEESE